MAKLKQAKKNVIITVISAAIAVGVTLLYYSTQKADINYYKGHHFFLKGEYASAIPYYEKALEIDPSKIKALREIAYSYMWTEHGEKAVEYFNRALVLNPEEYELKKSLAETLSWQKNYQKAIALYEEVIAQGVDPESEKRLAEVYIWKGDTEKAKEILKKYMDRFPSDNDARLLWGKALLYSENKEDREEASEVFEGLLKEEDSAREK